MWSRKAPRTAPKADAAPRVGMWTALVIAGVAVGLAGCGAGDSGFHPLYVASSGTTVDERLASVEITNVPGRVGQRIRNELVFQRSVGNDAVAPDKRLDIVVTDNVLTTLVDITGASSSQVYQLEARYQLVDLKTKKKIFEGRSLGRGSFDRFQSTYSNIRGLEDAQNRVAKSVAEEIRTRVLTFLSRPS